jgi:hypothetical protein
VPLQTLIMNDKTIQNRNIHKNNYSRTAFSKTEVFESIIYKDMMNKLHYFFNIIKSKLRLKKMSDLKRAFNMEVVGLSVLPAVT